MAQKSGKPDNTWAEEDIFGWLTHGLQSDSKDHYYKRVSSLEELQRRTERDSLTDTERTIDVVLDAAKKYGAHDPESSLIIPLKLLILKNDDNFGRVLDGLKRKERQLFFCFSKVVPYLDKEKKKRSIRPLVSFLMGGDSTNEFGLEDVYKTLTIMNGEEVDREILKLTSPYLASLKAPVVFFAVRLGSKLGDRTLTEQMLKVFEKSFMHYYDGTEQRIQEEMCAFFRRIPEKGSLPFILRVLQSRRSRVVLEALASVVDANPEVLKEIYQTMEEGTDPQDILVALAKTKSAPIQFERILNLTMKHLGNPSIWYPLKDIALRIGESAKDSLLELAKSRDHSEHNFAILCLNEMGVSFDEISELFEKNPIVQVYDFFFENKKKLLLDELWKNKRRLGDQLPGKWLRIEYLAQNVLSAFGFLVIYVDPSGREGVDMVVFSPDTLDCYVVGCTTGVLKDDALKLRATLVEMERDLEEFFAKYRVTPVIFSLKEVDLEYSGAYGMAVLTPEKINKLMEMLKTNRTREDVSDYILQNIYYEASTGY